MMGKETLGSRALVTLAIAFHIVLFGLITPSQSRDAESRCDAVQEKWERVIQDLAGTLHQYEEIQRTPLQKILGREIVDFSTGKTIAKQIADAIQVKEELLSAKRKQCQDLLNVEKRVFDELDDCFRKSDSDKQGNRLIKKIEKNRKSVVDKAKLAIVEVRAVEGQDSASYSQAYQSPYGRDQGYWHQYQQMYQGYWGR